MFTEVGDYQVWFMIEREGYETYVANTPGSVYIGARDIELQFEDNQELIDLSHIYDRVNRPNPSVIYPNVVDNENLDGHISYTYYRYNTNGTLQSVPVLGDVVMAGKYKLIVSFDGSHTNYLSCGLEWDFEIFKKTVSISQKSGQMFSKPYDGTRLEVNVSELNVEGFLEDDEFYGDTTLQTYLASAGSYVDENHFIWKTSHFIYHRNQYDVTDNYDVQYNVTATITKASFIYEANPYVGTYDGTSHTIDLNITYPVGGYNVEYSFDYENWSTDIDDVSWITVTDKKPVYFRITCDNFDPDSGQGSSYIMINPWDDTITLQWNTNFIYNGTPYTTPLAICNSTGAQTVYYYLSSDPELENPFMEAPVNAGTYLFRIAIANDGIYGDLLSNLQSITIFKKEVEVNWEDLSLVYNGSEQCPRAYYKDISNNEIDIDVKYDAPILLEVDTYDVYVENCLDSNYKFEATSMNTTFEITKFGIEEPDIKTDLEFLYRDEIIITDSYGRVYVFDNEGNVLSIIDYQDPEDDEDDIIETDLDLPYTMKISEDKNADRVTGRHFVTVSLKDPKNNMWANKLNSDNYEVDYVINPYELDNVRDTRELLASLSTYIYTYTGSPIEPEVEVFAIKSDGTDKWTLHANTGVLISDEFKVTYKNNIDISENNYATIIVEGINNFIFYKELVFEIKEDVPEKITLSGDSVLKFVKFSFNMETMEVSFTDNVSEFDRETFLNTYNPYDTESNVKEFIYLGHFHQQDLTFKKSVAQYLECIANDKSHIKVFTPAGEELPSTAYETSQFGSGYKICLYNDNGDQIDSVECIIFGDLKGNGVIDLSSKNTIKELVIHSDEYAPVECTYNGKTYKAFSTISTAFYFAAITSLSLDLDFDQKTLDLNCVSKIANLLSDSTKDFNSKYLY